MYLVPSRLSAGEIPPLSVILHPPAVSELYSKATKVLRSAATDKLDFTVWASWGLLFRDACCPRCLLYEGCLLSRGICRSWDACYPEVLTVHEMLVILRCSLFLRCLLSWGAHCSWGACYPEVLCSWGACCTKMLAVREMLAVQRCSLSMRYLLHWDVYCSSVGHDWTGETVRLPYVPKVTWVPWWHLSSAGG